MMNVKGVFCILPTPFQEKGELDEGSLRKLTEFQVKAGVHGLAILGVMGEAHKLSFEERGRIIQTVIDQLRGRLPVCVGVQALGTHLAIEQARQAEKLGASAVFAGPVPVQDDDLLLDFYSDLAHSIKIKLIIHDEPEAFRVHLSPSLLTRICKEIPAIDYLKLEDSPPGPKLTRLRELTEDRLKILGGLGGEFFLEELQRGAVGTMTGFSFPEVLVRVFEKFERGDQKGAARTFDQYVPLIRYEHQPRIGLAFRKVIYQRRGLIATTTVRSPGSALDAYTANELKQIVERVGLFLDKEGVQEVI
jgi:4-hydroxy-tetrahydrodipicolinate synthase